MTYATTYHADGTIEVWDVYRQQWRRADARAVWADIRLMATLFDQERTEIRRIAQEDARCDEGGDA